MAKLTTTSYTLLGLLKRHPWSAYELNKHMQISALRSFWPRAESHIYKETRNLEVLGLADCQQELHNGRQRNVYSITPAGEEALNTWLQQTPVSAFVTEYESALPFLYGEQTSPERIRELIEQLYQTVLDHIRQTLAVTEQIIQEGPREPKGVLFNAYSLHFALEQHKARLRWLKMLRERFADCTNVDQSVEQALPVYQQAAAELHALLAAEQTERY